jgi:hypothetical protein
MGERERRERGGEGEGEGERERGRALHLKLPTSFYCRLPPYFPDSSLLRLCTTTKRLQAAIDRHMVW